MKIIFATNQDDKSEVSYNMIYQQLPHLSPFQDCFSKNATRQNILEILNNHSNIALFATGHGENDKIIGHDELLAIGKSDAPLLQNRHVFAFCCWTANELGKEMQKITNASYWGYSGQLILHDYEQLDAAAMDILHFLYHHFETKDDLQIENIFNHLKDKCEYWYENILEKHSENIADFGIIMSASTSFTCIWSRLRVYIAHKTLKHKEAGEDILW